ncbi:putative Ig domain-containing protein [Chitinophaga horti]|uniref:Alpha-galactosidase n=1 Tax=Chitinophaga horti TaxID=2920382 RepID=A0ABY6J5Q6_9BACT|nr:putative Ig domain-containing protein [Chitinophaga horti]UYQ94840.1 putative Ig domain-containing protein [Chitinophaga horti]
MAQHKGAISLPVAKFATGSDERWSQPAFDDREWKQINTGTVWQSQGYTDYHGYAWYRIHVIIPSSLKDNAHWKDSLRVYLAHVNDVDETYLNGVKIGKTGRFPEDEGGYESKWPAVRQYHVAMNNPAIRWNEENVIAIKDYDGGGSGGIFMGSPYLDALERTDGLRVSVPQDRLQYTNKGMNAALLLQNQFNTTLHGVLQYTLYDVISAKDIRTSTVQVSLPPHQSQGLNWQAPNQEGLQLRYVFTEAGSGLKVADTLALPYILTPAITVFPKINNARVYGARPGHPFLFCIAATGEAPLTYEVTHLPQGLTLNAKTGVITGTTPAKGDYKLSVTVKNKRGLAKQQLTIKSGDQLSLTPPMGWNSWNCWGVNVSQDKVISSAQAMIDKGLTGHGWTYVNVDDGWVSPQRAADSSMVPNEKFPDMKGLGDWLHERGLKYGIYSSPGTLTCGGYLGSYGNERKDADTYAAWGVDYLKYDWCSYERIAASDTTLETYVKPFRVMQTALQAQPRDIFYNICQYGLKDVWKWGGANGAQSWRTTEDIEDTWESLLQIGFQQNKLYPYAHPGGWNDPDMMIVGQVGWGENLHPTRLTPEEQYTHVSLWCLLSAPLLIGCDLSKLDDFTLNLLTNDEVLAIDQDPLGKQAQRVLQTPAYEVWLKPLEDGSHALGIFNMQTTTNTVSLPWKSLGLQNKQQQVRDLWRQQDLGTVKDEYSVTLPPHGVRLLKIGK